MCDSFPGNTDTGTLKIKHKQKSEAGASNVTYARVARLFKKKIGAGLKKFVWHSLRTARAGREAFEMKRFQQSLAELER